MASELESDMGRTAADIMYSDQYLDLIDRVYSEKDSIAEFEINPKHFLARHGIRIPDTIDVVIHEPGALGRPARVDFHWGPDVPARAKVLAARRRFRELARLANDTMHSPEMRRLVQKVIANPASSKEFASNPNAYAQSQGIAIPDGFKLVVHLEDAEAPRVDLHFDVPGDISELVMAQRGPGAPTTRSMGCCYCSGPCCCHYYIC